MRPRLHHVLREAARSAGNHPAAVALFESVLAGGAPGRAPPGSCAGCGQPPGCGGALRERAGRQRPGSWAGRVQRPGSWAGRVVRSLRPARRRWARPTSAARWAWRWTGRHLCERPSSPRDKRDTGRHADEPSPISRAITFPLVRIRSKLCLRSPAAPCPSTASVVPPSPPPLALCTPLAPRRTPSA